MSARKDRKRKAPVIGPPRPVEPTHFVYWGVVALMPGEIDPHEPPPDRRPSIHRTWGGIGEVGLLTKKKT